MCSKYENNFFLSNVATTNFTIFKYIYKKKTFIPKGNGEVELYGIPYTQYPYWTLNSVNQYKTKN